MFKLLKNKYSKIHNILFNPDYFTIRYWVFGISIALLLSYFYSIQKKEENNAFQMTKITFGVIDKARGDVSGKGPYFDFHYYNEKNQKIHIKTPMYAGGFTEVSHQCYRHRKVGDTMVVEYSLIDSTYARVLNCYWNEAVKREYKLQNAINDLILPFN